MTPGDLEKRFDFSTPRAWVPDFFSFQTEQFEAMLRKKDGAFWERLGERRALRLFKSAASRVPAYKDFLQRHHINAVKIRTIKDFGQVPETNKENYVQTYPLAARTWDGKPGASKLIAASSGTTGEPKYWPRSGFQEFEAAVIHELLYRSFFEAHKRKTLFLIGFPMGIYVSGVATLLPTWLAANKFPNASIMSIGNNKAEMLKALRNLPGDYDQVVLIGHPFFIKDVLETGKDEGVRWKKMKVRLMFCSEGVSEAWREYIIREIGGNINDLASVISTYGSSEFLLMGWETPFSISYRKTLGAQGRGMDVFQYNPLHRYIEAPKDELLFTAASGVPLIRYNLKDAGKVAHFAEIAKQLPKRSGTWQLPFVTLSGRSDQAVVFYAANIYPEHIKAGLNERSFFRNLTGKFTMRKDYTKNMDEFLEINVELRPKIKPAPALSKRIRDAVVENLERINMEYRFLRTNLDKDLIPRVVLWPYGHERYFKAGLKPRYIAK